LITKELNQKDKGSIGVSTAPTVYSDSPIMMDTTEFGEDLFHCNTMELDNGFADSPTIAGLRQHRRAGIRKFNWNMNEFDSSQQESTPPYFTPPTIQSPSRKGPLSANSSQTSSRLPSPLFGRQSSLEELSENVLRTPDQLFGADKAEVRDLRTDPLDSSGGGSGDGGSNLDVSEITYDRLTPSSPLLISAMSKDQNRWKSPTLSALASPSSSRGPSPRALSPSLLSHRSQIATTTPSRHSDMSRRHISQSTAINDMRVDIPLIETRDEVPLQDIWRMEDEERKDRLNGAYGEAMSDGSIEGHIRNMKGEQHAHEEARLIQDAIETHSREAL
jgi:hypothetical protein